MIRNALPEESFGFNTLLTWWDGAVSLFLYPEATDVPIGPLSQSVTVSAGALRLSGTTVLRWRAHSRSTDLHHDFAPDGTFGSQPWVDLPIARPDTDPGGGGLPEPPVPVGAEGPVPLVTGYLQGAPSTDYTVSWFAGPSCATPESEMLSLGGRAVRTSLTGRSDVSLLSSVAVPSGWSVFGYTATELGVRSRRSDCIAVLTRSVSPAGSAEPSQPPAAVASSGPRVVAVSATSLIRLPTTRRCVAGRRLGFRLSPAAGVDLESAIARIDGKKAKTVRGRRLKTTIYLTNLPRRPFALKVVATTVDGRVFQVMRRYRPCSR
jgi:hypothetical protein